MLNENGFAVFGLPPLHEDELASFGDLAFDSYVGTDTRYRRFAQYRLSHEDVWSFERLAHRPYMTYSKYNSVAGGIERHYEPICVDFTRLIAAAADAIELDKDDVWQLNVHQYRIHALSSHDGVIVPEGPHQDGHEYVLVAVIAREGITGAETQLLPVGGGEPFYRTTLNAGEGIVLADRDMWHFTSDIEAVEGAGHRDTLVAAFSRWSERWYGDEFERHVKDAG